MNRTQGVTPANPFTPISASEYWEREFSRRHGRGGNASAPLIPGQSYYGIDDRRESLYWEGDHEEKPCYGNDGQDPPPGSWENQSFFKEMAAYPAPWDIEAQKPAEDPQRFQYFHQAAIYPHSSGFIPGTVCPGAYSMPAAPREPENQWEGHPYPPSFPPAGEHYEPIPEYLFGDGQGFSEPFPVVCPYDQAQPVPSAGEPAPLLPEPPVLPSPIVRASSPLLKPPTLYHAKRAAYKAFATQQSQRPKWSVASVIVTCITVILIIFFALAFARLFITWDRDAVETEMRRETYLSGASRESDASRVELLPVGVTFAPTAIPAATTGQMSPERQADSALPAISGSAGPRVRQRQYPDNPLGVIREEFAGMNQVNSDMIGRLVIDGIMDEAIVYRDNTFYLTHSVSGVFSAEGAVFMDEACSIRTPPENLHLRGHSKVQGKVFAPLKGFVGGGEAYVRSHAVIKLSTLYEEAQFVVFAVVIAAGDIESPAFFNFAGYPSFESDAQMDDYIAEARRLSLYEIPVEVRADDRLLTLSTLSEGTAKESLVVLARKLRPGETLAMLSGALNGIRKK